MPLSPLDPRWTERAPTMRILDPLGTESTEGSLQDRLLRPVLSIAITQRLRYLSYWAWVTDHLDRHDAADRALYEKILLVASTHHDCSSTGTGTNGIMGDTDEIEALLDDSTVDELEISSAAFTIAGDDNARFDSYYKGVLYRLLLFEDEWTLTSLGQQLADAYDSAIAVEFDEVQAAVEHERVSIDLIERATTGCLCRLSETERDVLTHAYWYLVTPTDRYNELSFDRQPRPELLRLDKYLKEMSPGEENDAVIKATVAGTDAVEGANYSEDLDLFFATGRDVFVRSSLVLLLSLGNWIQQRPTPTPEFGPLSDTQEAWRLLIHAEYASYAFQSLFIAILEGVKQGEPIAPDQLLSTLFADPGFDREAGRALAGLSPSEGAEDDRSVLAGIRDVVYFEDAPTGPLEVTLVDDADPVDGTWLDVGDRLQRTDPDDDPFVLSGHSERAYQVLIHDTLSEPRSIAKSRRVAAYSAIALARITARYPQYFGTDAVAPFVDWFLTAQEDPSAATCWQLSDAYEDSTAVTDHHLSNDWPASSFALTTAGFTRRWILDHYFERLYEKIKDGNGKSPQLLHIDADGQLTYDHEITDGGVYNGGYPNAPTMKFDRLGDIFYELGLTKGNSLKEMQVTDRGRQLVDAFTTRGSA